MDRNHCAVFDLDGTLAATIEDIAASAGISVSTLLRLYHDILRTTPIQYVLKYRLEQIRDEVKALDINNLTPLEALNKLSEIKRLVGGK